MVGETEIKVKALELLLDNRGTVREGVTCPGQRETDLEVHLVCEIKTILVNKADVI